MSANHQLTVPRPVFEDAGLAAGDRFRIEAVGPGTVLATRAEEVAQRHAADLGLDLDP